MKMVTFRRCVFYATCPYIIISLFLLIYKHWDVGSQAHELRRYTVDGVPIPSSHGIQTLSGVGDGLLNGSQNQNHIDFKILTKERLRLSFHHNVSASEFIRRKPQRKRYELGLDVSTYDKIFNHEIVYEPFTLAEPNFTSDEDRRQFFAMAGNVEYLGVQPKEKLRGLIQVIPNGIANMDMDCGWPSKLEDFFSEKTQPAVDILIPLLVPDSASFQHFLDGTMPKIVQSYSILTAPNVKLLIFHPRDSIIFEILNKLNITTDKLVFYTDTIGATIQINSCVTPPLHPLLWREARRMLGAPERLSVHVNQSNVILLTRAGSYNGGRHMLNFEEIKTFLKNRYSSRFVIFEGGYNLERSTQIFGKTSILIGVHGGAMYNLNFASSDTHIVEFLPMVGFGIPMERIAHSIIWHMSKLLGQTYWRIHQIAETDDGDMNVPIDKLATALDKIDSTLNSLSRH